MLPPWNKSFGHYFENSTIAPSPTWKKSFGFLMFFCYGSEICDESFFWAGKPGRREAVNFHCQFSLQSEMSFQGFASRPYVKSSSQYDIHSNVQNNEEISGGGKILGDISTGAHAALHCRPPAAVTVKRLDIAFFSPF